MLVSSAGSPRKPPSPYWDEATERPSTPPQQKVWMPAIPGGGNVDGASTVRDSQKVVETELTTEMGPDLKNLNSLQQLVRVALWDDSQKDKFLHLSESDAQLVLDEMWTLLDLPLIPKITTGVQSYIARNKLRRFSLKVSLTYDKLPTSLFLTGVVNVESESRGIGGFADVYCGSWGETVVAIKRLRVYLAAPETQKIKLRQAFCRESMLWKNLSHRHILPFLGVSEDVFKHRALSMILPWMSKGSIRHYIDSLRRHGELQGDLFTNSVQEWLYQIALGLSYLHDEGIVHGDLHGGNILIDEDDTVRLTDFGMALIAEATSYQYASVHGGGATRWQAPELIDPDEFGLESSRPTFASDIYSFSCICIELYTGEPPFVDLADRQLIRRVVKGARPSRPVHMSDEIWYLVNLCWHPDRDTRPSSSAIAQTLGRISLVPSTLTFGRYRPPTATIIRDLQNIFAGHPRSTLNSDGETSVPSAAVLDIVTSFVSALEIDILSKDDLDRWFTVFTHTPMETTFTVRKLLALLTIITISPNPSRTWRNWGSEAWSGGGQTSAWDSPWTASDSAMGIDEEGWGIDDGGWYTKTPSQRRQWGSIGESSPRDDNSIAQSSGWRHVRTRNAGRAPPPPPPEYPPEPATSAPGWRNVRTRTRRLRRSAAPASLPPPLDIQSSPMSWAEWQPDPHTVPSPISRDPSPGLFGPRTPPGLFGPRSPRSSSPPFSPKLLPQEVEHTSNITPRRPLSVSLEEIGGKSVPVPAPPSVSRVVGAGAGDEEDPETELPVP